MTHLTLEQCKKLKDLGFPQIHSPYFRLEGEDCAILGGFELMELYYSGKSYYACPTLEELIEWLGDDYNKLFRIQQNAWEATPPDEREFIFGRGATPLEAVYNLAIAIKSPQ